MKKNDYFVWEWKIPGLQKLLRVMKLTIFLILISVGCVFASKTYSQNKTLNLKLKKVSVKEVLLKIEDQSEFYFMYSEKIVDVNREVSVNIKDQKINEVLNNLFAGTNVKYTVKDRFILLITPEVTGNYLTSQQQKTITGKVLDELGDPIPGVNVFVKGTTEGTITDTDGKYSITSLPDDAVLVFSFIGMKTLEITVGEQTNIDITMEFDSYNLNEVVTIGYGTQKKVNITGAVGLATAERLENRPIVSAGQGLQGVIPNLNIIIPDGNPASNAIYNIRGFESINGGAPLILVDGIPMSLERINPNDIKSVSVLKDAGSSAIYGARAAFGVILVETKKAKKGKVRINFSAEYSLTKPIFTIKSVNDPYEFASAWNIASTRTDGTPRYNEEWMAGFKKWSDNPIEENAWEVVNGDLRFYGGNDWQDMLITDLVPQQKYDFSVSSGSEDASFYASFGYLDKDGMYNSDKNENFKRINGLMKAEFKVNDWLSLDEKIAFNSVTNDQPHGYVQYSYAAQAAHPLTPATFPDLPYYNEPGDHDEYAPFIGMYFDNVLPYLEDGGRYIYTQNELWLTQGVTLTPMKGLKIRGDFSYMYYNRIGEDVQSKVLMVSQNLLTTPFVGYGRSASTYIKNNNYYNKYYVFNTYGEYTIGTSEKNYLKAMVGFNQEWANNTGVRTQANDLITPAVSDINATTGPQLVWGGKSHLSLRGIFYRLNYIHKDKYLLELNGRYDGTSRFPKESRFGFFPSASVAWRISKEGFLDGTKGWLDNLKIRASYGQLGNQTLGGNYYPYIASMSAGMSNMAMIPNTFNPYVSSPGLVSPSLTWETVISTNIGVDITMLQQRLNISADLYTRDTKDMLMKVKYPDILGTSAPAQNAADLRTSGWELAVNWRDNIGKDWKYGFTLALSDNTSEITKYDNPTGALSEYYVGKKLGEIWGYETVGIFQYDEDVAAAADQSRIGSDWRAGDIQFADLDGDMEITRGNLTLDDHGDYKIIGNTTPRYAFGINGDLQYKNWSLNLFLQGNMKKDFMPSGSSNWVYFYPFKTEIIGEYYLTESWSEDNRDAYFPAPHISTNVTKNYQNQSRYLQNAAYIRLKNVTLSYDIPHTVLNKVGLNSVQAYLSGMNLWEFSKIHSSLDPETVGLTERYYRQRIFTLGVKIGL